MHQEARITRYNRICLFYGSRTGYKPVFDQAAVELCKHLVIFSYAFGEIHGELKIVAEIHGELKIVAVHVRKSEMKKHADAFIAVP
ncbi:Cytokinin riboside 5'-monophosphate phosphoribohydrolase LOG7, partial [Bienertia sinuspersici]